MPPDRATWPGWVEMESEPAFFNVMLKDMGVRGVKVQEVYSLDEEMLAILPQPVHALIFLFRYRETDNQQQENGSCPPDVWFANQTPEYACASFALLNIVNNVPGLDLGTELQKFRDFTMGMDPLSRGDAVDDFDFVKRIHNSFAREVNMLETDMCIKNKMGKLRKRQAVLKANETKKAKKAKKDELAEAPVEKKPVPPEAAVASPMTSTRTRKPARKSPAEAAVHADPDGDFGAPAQPKQTASANGDSHTGPRRSGRAPKPRQDPVATTAATTADEEEEDGFHFVAYMPIKGHVWKLDGLDRFPQDMGTYGAETGGEWMNLAQPLLMGRMAQYEASEIQFNLMAIVHDSLEADRRVLMENVRALQMVDKTLDGLREDWRSTEVYSSSSEIVTRESLELGISVKDIAAVDATPEMIQKIHQSDTVEGLLELRKQVVMQQAGLRATVRDAVESAKADDERARHRRHDYGTFVRAWLGALAEDGMLDQLVEALEE